MTVYNLEVTVPLNVTDISRVSVPIEIEGEVLHRVYILIPFGHMELTGIRIRYGDKQIVPWNEGSWIKGGGRELNLTPNWILPESPCTIWIDAYNLDVCYDHTFYITLETTTYEEVFGPELYPQVIDQLAKVLGVV